AGGEAADGDDESRSEDRELPLAPERAEALFLRRRGAVASAGRCLPRIAARDGGAVERRVELVLLEPEPVAQSASGATAPRTSLEPLLDARCLAVQVRPLVVDRRDHRQRLERVARLGAGTAGAEVALERAQRAVGRPAPRHAARTATNQRPAKSVSPPPSSAASPSGVNQRL